MKYDYIFILQQSFQIISIEILIILQKSLSQYIPHQYYNRYYTQAAYFEPFQNEEYSWTKRENIQTKKAHRKRKKYYDYYMSAEIDERPRKLKCKCTCKKYKTKPFQEYDQRDPCCQSYCDNNRDNANGIYSPTQNPAQYPNTVNAEMFTPVQYPSFSIIYPTIDLSEIGKAFPWLTWGVTKPTKIDTNGNGKDTRVKIFKMATVKITMKDDKDRTSTRDDRDKTSTIGDRDRTTDSTISNKHESSTKDIGGKTSTINERDKTMTSDDKYKTTTVSDRDFSDKTTRRDDGDGTNAEDSRDGTRAIEKHTTESTTTTTTSTTTTGTAQDSTTESTPESTLSTSYEAGEKFAKLFHHCSKKKKCLQRNNYCSHKNNKIGRYFENDLVERPTIPSYLNGRRRN